MEGQARPEILESFRWQVHGRAPVDRPQNLPFAILESQADALNGAATRKRIRLSFAGRSGERTFHALLYIPNHVAKKASCLLLINNRNPSVFNLAQSARSPFWLAEEIVKRGYAAAV